METVIRVLNRSQSCYDASMLSHACLIEIIRASYLSELELSKDEFFAILEELSDANK